MKDTTIRKDLSIITVNYRGWNLLEKYFASFKEYPPTLEYEIIVVDNDSQDGMFHSFSKKHPNIKFIKNIGNHGFSNGCNLGSIYASGKYLLFLNPDTELTQDNAIDSMYHFLKNHSEVGIVSCRTITPKGTGREINFLSPWLLIPILKQIYKFTNKEKIRQYYPLDADVWYPDWVTGSVILINSQLFSQVGRWNDRRYWMYYEDPDLCLRVKEKGKKIALLRNKSIKHIGGGISKSSTKSTIRSKVENIISAHNYIQNNTNFPSNILIHILHMTKTLSPIIILIITLPFFRSKKYNTKLHVLLKSCNYYINALHRRTWKNPKLDLVL